jgi:hypothetical protein
LTWICLTAGGYVRSDASDLTLAHSHSHKWHHAPLLCPPITCYVTVIKHAHCYAPA